MAELNRKLEGTGLDMNKEFSNFTINNEPSK